MKKIITIVLVIAVIAGVISYGVDELSSDSGYDSRRSYNSHDTYDTYDTYDSYDSYDYYNSNRQKSYNCILCNNTGKVSCNHCYGQGEISQQKYVYGEGYAPAEKVDCAYCVGGKTDCTLC